MSQRFSQERVVASLDRARSATMRGCASRCAEEAEGVYEPGKRDRLEKAWEPALALRFSEEILRTSGTRACMMT